MSEQGVAAVRKLPPAGAAGILRFLFADTIGISFLAWLLIAFVLRPMVMDAHAGVAGPATDFLRAKLDMLSLARTAGALQGVSLLGLMLVLILVHTRLMAALPEAMSTFRSRLIIGLAYSAALCVGFLVFVWTPTTAISLMLHDTFIFYDGIYRIDQGQHPSVDFPTALGAATLYLPWLGSKISGGYAGSIEMASIIVALPLCAACALACANRHGGAVAAVLITAIFLMVVPSMLEGFFVPDSRTFEHGNFEAVSEEFANAMFYNRWGWGALIAVFAFLTPRQKGEAAPLIETIVLGLLLTFLFWLKLSYFVVGAAAAILYAFLGAQPWRTLGIGVGVAGGAIALVALITGNLFGYLGDIFAASRISGARISELAPLLKDNLLYILLAVAPLVAMGLTKRLKPIDYGVTALILGGTLFVVNQNAQESGLPTLLVATAYALWRLRDDADRSIRLLAVLAFALPAATYTLDRIGGVIGQASVARREEARPAPSWASIPALRNVHVQEHESILPLIEAAVTPEDRIHAFRMMSVFGRRQYLRSGEYIATMQAAMADLKPVMATGDSVVVMDFSSPLAFLMNARPAKGYWITFDHGRTISEEVHPEAAKLFADADHVMWPKLYVEPDTALSMNQLYASWLDGAYEERVETPYWTRWSHRKPAPAAATQTALIPLKNGLSRAVATQH